MIIETCPWLRLATTSGMSRLLQRLGISYKRGRDYVHSPDVHYEDKVHLIEMARFRAYYEPERYVFLYLDELTYYRQPSVAPAYEASGHQQALARRSHARNTAFRILGALNIISGQVIYLQRSHTDVKCLTDLWFTLRETYPLAEMIYIVVDNWPVHFHPDVLAPLQPQNFPWPPKLPRTGLLNPAPRRGETTCRSRCCAYLPTLLGSIPLRNSGAGSNKTSCICIATAKTGQALKTWWQTFSMLSATARTTYFTTWVYYRSKL